MATPRLIKRAPNVKLEADESALLVPMESISPGYNARQKWDVVDDRLTQLAHSIDEKGVLEPLLVRELHRGRTATERRFELVAGFRRFAAARHLGLRRVPVRVLAARDDEAVALNLAENLAREDLTDADALRAVEQLQTTYSWGVRQIARATGRSVGWISELLAVARSRPERSAVEAGQLALGGAARMVRLKEEFPQLRTELLGRLKSGERVQVEEVPRVSQFRQGAKGAAGKADEAETKPAAPAGRGRAATSAARPVMKLSSQDLALVRNARTMLRQALATLRSHRRDQKATVLPSDVRTLLEQARDDIEGLLEQDAKGTP
jgi:ParB/RepB/Spo0J family partition protein